MTRASSFGHPPGSINYIVLSIEIKMNWRTHAAITRSVSRAIGLAPEIEDVMVNASMEPDRVPIKRKERGQRMAARVRHHGNSGRIIRVLIWKSRLAFIRGDHNGGARALGLAMHYVQDQSVSPCRTWKRHRELENRIGHRQVPEDLIRAGLETAISSPIFIDACIGSIRPHRDSYGAICQAACCSAALAEAVTSDLEPPHWLKEAMRRSVTRRHFVHVPFVIASSASIFALAFIISSPLVLAFLMIPLSYIVWINKLRGEMQRLAEWYGIA